MVGTTTDRASGFWNKKPSNTATNVGLLVIVGAMVLFEAWVPRPLLQAHDWRYTCAFMLFSACGVLLFGSLKILNLWAGKSPDLMSIDILRVCTVLLSCLGMVWITSFTEYKRMNPSFDSYASAVFGGFLVGLINAASLKNHPSEN
jgi:hypothetical protein